MEHTFDERIDCAKKFDDLKEQLDAWFLVSGDTDDFIFFGENDRFPSEK